MANFKSIELFAGAGGLALGIEYTKETLFFVELKNKHNTMNSSSSQKTFMKMQNHLLNSKNSKDICALVEVIAKKSANEPWIKHTKDFNGSNKRF